MVEKARALQARPGRPVGHATRGTTAANRMRRVDRWLAQTHGALLASEERPLIVDLGFGASHVTPLELFRRLRVPAPGAEVVGLEIDPDRVRRASAYAEPGLSFRVGGFEVPTERRPVAIRAFNVLRQYPESDVPAAWAAMTARLSPGGVLIEGTCDEIGRIASWAAVDVRGPQTLTIAVNPWRIGKPSDAAERLPKALIHRNVPGEGVHELFRAADRAWELAAGLGSFSPRQRWMATANALAADGWVLGPGARDGRVLGGPQRFRLGEMTVPWERVAPSSS